jgi:hypothetical protein
MSCVLGVQPDGDPAPVWAAGRRPFAPRLLAAGVSSRLSPRFARWPACPVRPHQGRITISNLPVTAARITALGTRDSDAH